jgi:transposase-like protein
MNGKGLTYHITHVYIESDERSHWKMIEWQSRQITPIYLIIHFVCFVVKISQDKRIINKYFFLTIGINTEDH